MLLPPAEYLGERGAQIIDWAWKQGTISLYGLPVGESEPAEIIFREERGRLDCANSRVVSGMMVSHQSVTIRWSDIERLAQFDVQLLKKEAERLASQPPNGTAQTPRPRFRRPRHQPACARLGLGTVAARLARTARSAVGRAASGTAIIPVTERGPLPIATERKRGRPPSVRVEDDAAMDALERTRPGLDDYCPALKAALGDKYRNMKPATLNRRAKTAEQRRRNRRAGEQG